MKRKPQLWPVPDFCHAVTSPKKREEQEARPHQHQIPPTSPQTPVRQSSPCTQLSPDVRAHSVRTTAQQPWVAEMVRLITMN